MAADHLLTRFVFFLQMLKRQTRPGRRLRRLRRAARVRPCPAVGAPSSRWRRARSCARHSFRGGLRACVPAPPSVLRHRVGAVLMLAASPPLLRPLAIARDLRPGGTRRKHEHGAPAPPSRLRRLQCRRARPCAAAAVCLAASAALTFVKKKQIALTNGRPPSAEPIFFVPS